MPKQAYSLSRPTSQTSSVVFASPHSGCDYPEWFLRRTLLNAHTIRSSEDAFVDRLFQSVPRFGSPFLVAGAPRAFVDFNRSSDELDPALIQGLRRRPITPRVASGLGVIPRVVANGRAIYNGKLVQEEANHRIETYWRPYHNRLQSLLDETCATFGRAILIDCHSMPHEALDTLVRTGVPRPDVVLGDRFGASADSYIVEEIESAFALEGLRVSRNAPFAGAYVTQHYGRPVRKQHAIQIEIDRSLYMDEARIEPRADFGAFQLLIDRVIKHIIEIGKPRQEMAAE
ncbi:N-formylglutamate deformylase [Shimia gijangensis]|uniref:N-formylglutamate deformylase n=1 Tax=Shimia gijangensis TaxID=1470563 RepID=A0A1M6NJW4_9RHOB|nr:N-formylglutamate amidohydrolase [Shimia gijangensis]SHJ95987.1 N-formylglutamate deformylase [Shimia gijangensis]